MLCCIPICRGSNVKPTPWALVNSQRGGSQRPPWRVSIQSFKTSEHRLSAGLYAYKPKGEHALYPPGSINLNYPKPLSNFPTRLLILHGMGASRSHLVHPCSEEVSIYIGDQPDVAGMILLLPLLLYNLQLRKYTTKAHPCFLGGSMLSELIFNEVL